MAWQVAIVVDDETSIGSLIGWLPVWTWSTPTRRAAAPEFWEGWNNVWAPEPALTLMATPLGQDPIANILAEIPTIQEHHPSLTALRFFGLTESDLLHNGLRTLGYEYKHKSEMEGLLFARPLSSLDNLRDLILDARKWKCADDVYDAFFEAVGAPDWHGKNFNALDDSISTGAINKIEVPYRIMIRNLREASPLAVDFTKEFVNLIEDLGAKGCPVAIEIQS